jgi:hypothetical protein
VRVLLDMMGLLINPLRLSERVANASEDTPPNLPMFDSDGDRFSTKEAFRGSDWRGKDCNDLDATVYPGRLATDHAPLIDHNCNGISGKGLDGLSFEDKYCKGTGQRGVTILGDSAAAHFSIPPAWVTAKGNSAEVWSGRLCAFFRALCGFLSICRTLVVNHVSFRPFVGARERRRLAGLLVVHWLEERG